MTSRCRRIVICSLGLLLLVLPAFAHHSFTAEFDASKCVDFTGTLTSYDWENRHAYFNVGVKDGSSTTVWSFQTVSLAYMKRSGTQRRDFIDIVGKAVTVRACPSKNGAKRAAAETIKTPDGKTLRVGDDYEHGSGNFFSN